MLDRRARAKETRLYDGLSCPRCGRSFVPISSGDTVAFLCKTGHELTLLELDAKTQDLRRGLQALLAGWEKQLETLVVVAEDARKHGYLEIAGIYHRQRGGVAARIEALRAWLAKADSDTSRRLRAVSAAGVAQGVKAPTGRSPCEGPQSDLR
jgi:hypothetical protein